MSEEKCAQIIWQIKLIENNLEQLYEQIQIEEDWEQVCLLYEKVNNNAVEILNHNISLRSNPINDLCQLSFVINC
jgi:hypothetical protein